MKGYEHKLDISQDLFPGGWCVGASWFNDTILSCYLEIYVLVTVGTSRPKHSDLEVFLLKNEKHTVTLAKTT